MDCLAAELSSAVGSVDTVFVPLFPTNLERVILQSIYIFVAVVVFNAVYSNIIIMITITRVDINIQNISIYLAKITSIAEERETETETEKRETDRQTDTATETERGCLTDDFICNLSLNFRQTDRQTDRQAGRQAGRQTDRDKERLSD